MAEFENPFADPEAQNLFHVSSIVVTMRSVLLVRVFIWHPFLIANAAAIERTDES